MCLWIEACEQQGGRGWYVVDWVKTRLHRRFLSCQLDAIFIALKLQLQNRTCKPGAIFSAICRRDIAGVSNIFETCCNLRATKIASSCCDKNRLCRRALSRSFPLTCRTGSFDSFLFPENYFWGDMHSHSGDLSYDNSSNTFAHRCTRLICTRHVTCVMRYINAIHRINHYPADSVVCFVNTYPLDKRFIRWIALSSLWATGA